MERKKAAEGAGNQHNHKQAVQAGSRTRNGSAIRTGLQKSMSRSWGCRKPEQPVCLAYRHQRSIRFWFMCAKCCSNKARSQ